MEMLDFIHLNKTAALIVAAVRAGASLGNPTDKMMEDLSIYGENMGLAFQIADDILDVVGEEEKMGKKTGMDNINNKATYPNLYGLENSRRKLDELTDNAVKALAVYYDNAELFTTLARDLARRGK